MAHLDLAADVVTLTEQLVNTFSVSHHEQEIADAVEDALRTLPHLTVTRRGHTLVARTDLGRSERVVIAGHLDTVPLNDNLPALIAECAEIMDITPPGHAIPMMAEFSFGPHWYNQFELGERPCEKQVEEALSALFTPKEKKDAA